MISTEALLTSTDAFGITTATPAQRAICRILDGVPLAELAAHPDVLELVGGAEAVATLPSERGVIPLEAIVLAAIRSAKTIIACAAALRMTQTVDVSRLGPGEIPRVSIVSIVSLKLDVTFVPYRLLLDTIQASSALRGLLVDASVDVITARSFDEIGLGDLSPLNEAIPELVIRPGLDRAQEKGAFRIPESAMILSGCGGRI